MPDSRLEGSFGSIALVSRCLR